MIRLIKFILIFFSLLLFFIVLYKLLIYEKLFDFYSHRYYFKYYLVSLILIFIAFLIDLINEEFVKKFFLTFVSLTILFYFIEITLRMLEVNNRGNDKRSIKKIYKDELKVNQNTTITLPPTSMLNRKYSLLPLSHIPNNFIIDCNELGYYAINKSDKYGFNNDNSTWNKKIDFLMVGDSFSYGQCVFRKNNIASNLMYKKKINILNLSMPGNGLLLNFAILKEYLPKVKTNSILWFVNDMDFENLNREKKEIILLDYLYKKNFSQDLHLKKNEILKIQKDLFKKKNSKLYLESFFSLAKTKIFINNYINVVSKKTFDKIEYTNELEMISKTIFNELGNLKAKGYDIHIIHIPIKNKLLDKNYDNKFKYIAEELSKKNNLNFISIEEIFENLDVKKKLKFYSKNYSHFTEEGYKHISNQILKNLD